MREWKRICNSSSAGRESTLARNYEFSVHVFLESACVISTPNCNLDNDEHETKHVIDALLFLTEMSRWNRLTYSLEHLSI